MLQWIDILRFANNGNLEPIHKVRKTDKEWKGVLSAEQFRITRQKGTEKAHSSEMCNAFDPGKYACVCCDTDYLIVLVNSRAHRVGRLSHSPFMIRLSLIIKTEAMECIESK